jgi:hypothetical protein
MNMQLLQLNLNYLNCYRKFEMQKLNDFVEWEWGLHNIPGQPLHCLNIFQMHIYAHWEKLIFIESSCSFWSLKQHHIMTITSFYHVHIFVWKSFAFDFAINYGINVSLYIYRLITRTVYQPFLVWYLKNVSHKHGEIILMNYGLVILPRELFDYKI